MNEGCGHGRRAAALLILSSLLFYSVSKFFSGESGTASPIRATWIWDLEELGSDYGQVLSFAREQRVSVIYLHVDLQEFSLRPYRSFIKKARAAGIDVFALGGDPHWALVSHRGSLTRFVSRVKNYNRVVDEEERFSGLHVDIEPYLLSEWKRDRSSVVEQWMLNAAYLIAEAKRDTPLYVSGDFPFWIQQISIPGTKTRLGRWMIERFDSITVMAYRRDPNEVAAVAEPLLSQAAEVNKTIVVAVNLLRGESGTRFHGKDSGELDSRLRDLEAKLAEHPGFSGTAVHDLKHWRTRTTSLEEEK